MLEKNKQEASNISGSLVQQANGDRHNHGLGQSGKIKTDKLQMQYIGNNWNKICNFAHEI